MKKTKNKNRDAQKKRASYKAVESVLRPEGSLWWERFVIALICVDGQRVERCNRKTTKNNHKNRATIASSVTVSDIHRPTTSRLTVTCTVYLLITAYATSTLVGLLNSPRPIAITLTTVYVFVTAYATSALVGLLDILLLH